jgi:hypothetical protein
LVIQQQDNQVISGDQMVPFGTDLVAFRKKLCRSAARMQLANVERISLWQLQVLGSEASPILDGF